MTKRKSRIKIMNRNSQLRGRQALPMPTLMPSRTMPWMVRTFQDLKTSLRELQTLVVTDLATWSSLCWQGLSFTIPWLPSKSMEDIRRSPTRKRKTIMPRRRSQMVRVTWVVKTMPQQLTIKSQQILLLRQLQERRHMTTSFMTLTMIGLMMIMLSLLMSLVQTSCLLIALISSQRIIVLRQSRLLPARTWLWRSVRTV